MAANFAKNFASTSLKLLTQCSSNLSSSSRGIAASHLKIISPRAVPNFSRSMWHMSSSTHQHDGVLSQPHSLPCGCCAIHTEGDKQLVEFLRAEIKSEKEQSDGADIAPNLDGFSVLAAGNDVSLTKSSGGETLKILWNVGMAGMEYEEDDEYMANTENEPQEPQAMAMPPNLMILLNKGRSSSLLLHCQPHPPEGGEEEEGGVELSIIDVGLVSSADCQGDYLDLEKKLLKSYKVSGNDMDKDMYDLLLSCLAERGVTPGFAADILAMHATYEHSQYIQFLERLKDFSAK